MNCEGKSEWVHGLIYIVVKDKVKAYFQRDEKILCLEFQELYTTKWFKYLINFLPACQNWIYKFKKYQHLTCVFFFFFTSFDKAH